MRVPGRHRAGVPPVRVEPRRWDPAKTAAAAQLDQLEPGWFISYGVGSRRFHAIATWDVPEGVCVETGTVEGLRKAMREAGFEVMARMRGRRGRAA